MTPCKEYERLWVNPDTNVDWCVDVHLTDQCLISLNRLTSLELRSVCEGHLGADGLCQQDHPIVRFRLRCRFVPSVRAVWCKDSDKILDFIYASLQSCMTIVDAGWSGVEEDVFYIDLDCTRKRRSEKMEPWVGEWFDEILPGLQTVDGRIKQLGS